ncbi:MAG TPA: ATP-dependent DNA ligase [Candidatus Rubrimentiphilum sp.]|nr:ATP-dependent DNA ligase [Candidatus Rubrimentiphilum sp.]
MRSFKNLPLRPPIEPMETKPVKEMPTGKMWLYEPKWDGFRCIAFRDGDDIALQSKSGQPLERYFPEIVEALKALKPDAFILDGELTVELDGKLDFDAILQRIHPAESRVKRLAVETPAVYSVFDALSLVDRPKLYQDPLKERRKHLEDFAARHFKRNRSLSLSPATAGIETAREWLTGGLAHFDGVIAKKLQEPYHFGDRNAVVKIKREYTADCVVGGFRLAKDGKTIASLLLGLYDDGGLLHLVGFVGSMSAAERTRAAELLKPLAGGSGFTGAQPGGPSRWGSREAQWHPVSPKIVVEVQYDRVTGERFRHGARLLRWRPDKAPRQCTMEQMVRSG